MLIEFAFDRLKDKHRAAIDAHLDECPACDEALLEIERETAAVAGGLAPETEQTAHSSLIQRLRRRARGEIGKPADDLSGQTLRDYRLIELIGRGGMGSVYRAEHVHLEKEVAIKVLPSDKLQDATAVNRFQREIKAVGKLDHPGIVRATDAGVVNGTCFLVMELIDGPNLSELVGEKGPLAVAQACRLTCQVAAGLQAAHVAGLVHRDIKPSNILLAPNDRAKLLDLGLALISNSDSDGGTTTTGTVMGTVDYMAPEQAEDTHNVDIRADIYSLGCTLYFLLTGSRPFDGDGSIVKTMMKHAAAPRPDVREIRDDVPKPLAEIIQRLMSVDREDRPTPPSEVVRLLKPYATGKSQPGVRSTNGAGRSAKSRTPRRQAEVAEQATVETDTLIQHSATVVTRAEVSRFPLTSTGTVLVTFAVFITVALGLAVWFMTGPGRTASPKQDNARKVESSPASATPVGASSESSNSLFDGSTLAGWTKTGAGKWAVADGAIVGEIESGKGWLVTEDRFRDFELQLEYQLSPGSNSGIFLRVPKDGLSDERPFVEIQLLDDTAEQWENLPDVQRTGSVQGQLAASPVLRPGPGEWHNIRICLVKSNITVWLNETKVVDGVIAKNPFPEGHIALQLYPHRVQFRDIQLRPINGLELRKRASSAVSNEAGVKFDGFNDIATANLGNLLTGIDAEVTLEAWIDGVNPSDRQQCLLQLDHKPVRRDFPFYTISVNSTRWGGGLNAKWTTYSNEIRWCGQTSKPLPRLQNSKRRMHVAATFWREHPDNKFAIFVDGQLVEERQVFGTMANHRPLVDRNSTTEYHLNVGGGGSQTMANFDGSVFAVRLSTGRRYITSFDPPQSFENDADTIALYDMLPDKNGVILDHSGNGFHADLQ